jgi:hypothetical protein
VTSLDQTPTGTLHRNHGCSWGAGSAGTRGEFGWLSDRGLPSGHRSNPQDSQVLVCPGEGDPYPLSGLATSGKRLEDDDRSIVRMTVEDCSYSAEDSERRKGDTG